MTAPPPTNGTSSIAFGSPAPGCPACGGAQRPERELFDDRYGFPGRFPLYLCSGCGHRRLGISLSSEKISSLYTTFYPRSSFDVEAWSPPQEKSSIVSWWHGLKASAFRWVPREVRVLDIGCGFGESLGYHRNRGCDAHGVEVDANIIRVAERYGLTVRVGVFDSSAYEPASFDVVTLDQVIEHLPDPAAVLRGVEKILKPGGTLFLSTPNASGWGAQLFGARWIHWHAPYHQHFFSRTSMNLAANSAGLEVESVRTITNSAWLKYQWCHLASLPEEGRPSSFWDTACTRTIGQRCGFAISTIVEKLGINASLTRLFDGLGVGDNFLFVIRKPDSDDSHPAACP